MHYSRMVITLGTLIALAFSSPPGWAQDSASTEFRRRSWDQDTQTVAPKEPRRFEALAPRIVWSAQIKPRER
jgi:hypothetical protein